MNKEDVRGVIKEELSKVLWAFQREITYLQKQGLIPLEFSNSFYWVAKDYKEFSWENE